MNNKIFDKLRVEILEYAKRSYVPKDKIEKIKLIKTLLGLYNYLNGYHLESSKETRITMEYGCSLLRIIYNLKNGGKK